MRLLWSRIADGGPQSARLGGNHGRVSYAAQGQSHVWPGPLFVTQRVDRRKQGGFFRGPEAEYYSHCGRKTESQGH